MRQLNGEATLCRTDISKGLVILPREFFGYCNGRAEAETGHRFEELGEAPRIGIEFVE
jgi:hypothetical protein